VKISRLIEITGEKSDLNLPRYRGKLATIHRGDGHCYYFLVWSFLRMSRKQKLSKSV